MEQFVWKTYQLPLNYKHIDRRAACLTRLRYRSCHELIKALALFSESRSFAFPQHQKRLNPLLRALTPIYLSITPKLYRWSIAIGFAFVLKANRFVPLFANKVISARNRPAVYPGSFAHWIRTITFWRSHPLQWVIGSWYRITTAQYGSKCGRLSKMLLHPNQGKQRPIKGYNNPKIILVLGRSSGCCPTYDVTR